MKDTELREQIERMDALRGGVVYGKEEAWEKLQARLDKPAKKTIALPYRLAAAAAVLLFVGIGIYLYTHTADEPVAATPVALIENAAPANVVPATVDTLVAPAPAPANETITSPFPKQETPRYVYTANEIKQPEIKPDTAIPIAVVENAIVPTPPPPPAKKMRVVHINDLGREDEMPAEAIVYNGPSLDISKMKVVSIYDVQHENQMRRQEEEIMTIARMNRPRNLLFSKQHSGNTPFAYNPLSIQLNRKN